MLFQAYWPFGWGLYQLSYLLLLLPDSVLFTGCLELVHVIKTPESGNLIINSFYCNQDLEMKNYFKNWNLIRIIQLALGILIIVQGVERKEWFVVIIGSLFSLIPLLGIGCCAGHSCSTMPDKNKSAGKGETQYEKVT